MIFQHISEIAPEMCLCLYIKSKQEKQVIMNSEVEGTDFILICSYLESY